MLLDGIEFLMVGVLGFLPLIVVQWAEWRPMGALKRRLKFSWQRAHSRRAALLLLLLTALLWLLLVD